MLVDFKDEDFENKIKNEDVSVIQFSAAWCGPCKALKPVMDKLAGEYKDKAGFYYADMNLLQVKIPIKVLILMKLLRLELLFKQGC